MNSIRLLFSSIAIALCLSSTLCAQGEDFPFEYVQVQKKTSTSHCGKASITVEIETFNHEDIRVVEKTKDGVEYAECWLGERRLLDNIVYHAFPSMIKSFKVTFDGKEIPVPARFYNDKPGMMLEEILDKRTKEQKTGANKELFEYKLHDTQSSLYPKISKSADGGTVRILWSRPEE